MRAVGAALAAMLFAAVVQAQEAATPSAFVFPAHVDSAGGLLPAGAREEARVGGDFDGDGRDDVALVVSDEERRALADDAGFRRIGVAEMVTTPLGDASLEVRKGVLLVTDLTGGTSAVQSTYRYRYEKESGRMRLIGDDVSLYSRTWQHGTTTISTNRLNGKRITTRNDLVGEPGENAELGPDQATTTQVPTEPKLYLETAPSPEATLGFGDE